MGGAPGGEASPSREGSSWDSAEIAIERAHVEAVEARVVELTDHVAALEDSWGRVD